MSQPDIALEKFLAGLNAAAEEFVDIHSDGENRKLVPEGQRPCPICGTKMQTQLEFGVTVDICREHGLWLDRKELGAILENYKSSAVQDFRLRTEYERGRDNERRRRNFL